MFSNQSHGLCALTYLRVWVSCDIHHFSFPGEEYDRAEWILCSIGFQNFTIR